MMVCFPAWLHHAVCPLSVKPSYRQNDEGLRISMAFNAVEKGWSYNEVLVIWWRWCLTSQARTRARYSTGTLPFDRDTYSHRAMPSDATRSHGENRQLWSHSHRRYRWRVQLYLEQGTNSRNKTSRDFGTIRPLIRLLLSELVSWRTSIIRFIHNTSNNSNDFHTVICYCYRCSHDLHDIQIHTLPYIPSTHPFHTFISYTYSLSIHYNLLT